MKIQNQKISNGVKISLLLITIFAILFLAGPISALANNVIEIDNPLQYDTVIEIINALTGLLKTIGFGIGLIMVIWGGIQIMTGYSTGEKEQKVVRGKKTIMWAVIGYAIIFLVDFIIGFVKELLGAE